MITQLQISNILFLATRHVLFFLRVFLRTFETREIQSDRRQMSRRMSQTKADDRIISDQNRRTLPFVFSLLSSKDHNIDPIRVDRGYQCVILNRISRKNKELEQKSSNLSLFPAISLTSNPTFLWPTKNWNNNKTSLQPKLQTKQKLSPNPTDQCSN